MIADIFLFIFSMVHIADTGIPKDTGYNTSELLDKLLSQYDKRLRPGFGGAALMVDVNMNIRSMGPISELDMAYQMDCYFRQSWVDRRLRFKGSLPTLTVSINLLDRLWKPDTHFINGKRSYLHTVTSPNKLLRIYQDGRILYSMRLTIKASCPMHLEKFPMDAQSCPLRFGSHGYDIGDVMYKWTHGVGRSIKMSPDLTLSQFDLVGIPHREDNTTIAGQISSALGVQFVLKRHMGYFLINVYVPCSLLVVLSWVGFWINREATADRIALGVTTVLTMAFVGIDNRTDLPKVSYSTALDYYVGICFAMVLATIIQFAGVHFFTKHGSGEIPPESDSEEEIIDKKELIEATKTTRIYGIGRNTHCAVEQNSNGNTRMTLHYNDRHWARRKDSFFNKFYNCLKGSASYRNMNMRSTPVSINSVSKIDTTARIGFPLVFLVFNIFYWYIYLQHDDIQDLLL